MGEGRSGDLVVLFSGGSDSTYTAYRMSERYERIHLLTFSRPGIGDVSKSEINFQRLQRKLGEDRVFHYYFPVDRLYRYFSYGHYLKDLWRFGFLNLSTCGLCKLAMHARAMLFCIEHGYTDICDGANINMYVFPAQIERCMDEIRGAYTRYGVRYFNPFYHLEDRKCMLGDGYVKESTRLLHEVGVLTTEELDEAARSFVNLDRRIQATCSDNKIFFIMTYGYYLPAKGFKRYLERNIQFYQCKMARFVALVDGHLSEPAGSRLGKLVPGLVELRAIPGSPAAAEAGDSLGTPATPEVQR